MVPVEYYGGGGRRPGGQERPNTGRPTFLGTISLYIQFTDDGTKWRLACPFPRPFSFDIGTRGDRFAQLYDVTCQGGVVQPLI